jgi:hypothetical protein
MSNQWYDIDTWQWVDVSTDEWGFGIEELNQIWTDETYVYAATSNGLNIIDIETEEIISKEQSYPYTTVWANTDTVFLGTNGHGIKSLDKSFIVLGEISSGLVDYVSAPDITNNNIKYLHGNYHKLMCCTISGVDIIGLDTHYVTHTTISGGAKKCFAAENDKFYYTVSGIDNWYLYRLDSNTGDWITPDHTYTTGNTFLSSASGINDIYVTAETSLAGNEYNTLFVSTDYGVHIQDEGTGIYAIYTTVS